MFSFKGANFQAKTFLFFFLICLVLEWNLIECKNSRTVNIAKYSKSPNSTFSPPITKTDKVVIGFVSCQSPTYSKPEDVFYRVGRHEQTLVMMKAIIISAKLYGVKQVDFHLFVENVNWTSVWFHKNSARNGWVENAGVEVNLYFHNAMNVPPEKHRGNMVYHFQYRCGFVRMFFSSALPDVDSIIYLDSDIIVTGSIAELWGILGKMNKEQLIGIARNNEPENYWVDHLGGFGDIPRHELAPKGLNSGVLVMNLTKMRESDWEKRFVWVYEYYIKENRPNMEDQRTINFMVGVDPESLYLVPCNFDVMHTNCDYGWICKPALEDPFGVQAIHGAGGHFGRNGRFQNLYIAYSSFTWDLSERSGDEFGKFSGKASNLNDISVRKKIFMEKIVKPARKYYAMDRNDSVKMKFKCFGTLDKLLFKNYEKMLM